MTKTESAILESRTPQDYIDRSLKARLPPAAKAKLARIWMESTGYSKDDILRARNRHPYWKKKKMEGSAERTKKRLSAHDYSGGSSVRWDERLVSEFLSMSKTDADGRYEYKDWQLAEHFGATIPSIQYMRRKLSKVSALLGAKAPRQKLVEYLLRAESVLSRGKSAVEGLKSAEKERGAAKPKKAAPKARAAKKTAVKKTAPKKAAPKKPAPKKAAPKKTASAKKRK